MIITSETFDVELLINDSMDEICASITAMRLLL